jgi:two-component system, NarL family, response regulator NreC
VCPPAQIQDLFDTHKIRCVLIHDHVLLRHGLRRLLEDEPDMEVVAEAGDVTEALRRINEHRPDVVLADAHLFEFAADQTEWLILQECPTTRVLFLTMHDGELHRHARLQEIGCAVQQTSAEQLAEMVRRVHHGEKPVVDGVPSASDDEPSVEEVRPRKRSLTAREREVVKLLAEGRTVRSAAGILGLSVKTVDAHKFNLMRKLGLHNKAELVMWAVQKRVVKVPAVF